MGLPEDDYMKKEDYVYESIALCDDSYFLRYFSLLPDEHDHVSKRFARVEEAFPSEQAYQITAEVPAIATRKRYSMHLMLMYFGR